VDRECISGASGGALETIDNGSGAVMVMDLIAYEALSGDSRKPDPSRQAQDDLLVRSVRLTILAGSMVRDNPPAVAGLRLVHSGF